MKKIAISIVLVCMTLIAAAQSSLTISIYNGPGVTCCPIVTSMTILVVDEAHCTSTLQNIPVPTCGKPVTYYASSLGGTDIIAAEFNILGVTPPISEVGDNLRICGDGPFRTSAGGGGGTTGVCQWEATWTVSGAIALLAIHT